MTLVFECAQIVETRQLMIYDPRSQKDYRDDNEQYDIDERKSERTLFTSEHLANRKCHNQR